ncbi:MAG TPA: sodium:proton antiporter [Deltaproteobacteria bacterium]|nr:sodium:proton antiporter [Deltaproteobacteria bacterium]
MLTEHQLLVFWLELSVLLLAARGLGTLMRRIRQPAVIGELAAGLLLGPSVLGQLSPAVESWLFPSDPVQRALLSSVGWLGAFLLLIVTGLETDLGLVRRLGTKAARVALGSLVIPVLCGLSVGFVMPDAFLGPNAQREVFALFMATALGISALPVIAKVLSELDLMRRNIAQVILAAAMADDVIGWILLGLVAGLAQSGEIAIARVGWTLLGLALFLAGAFTVGQRIVDALLREARRRRGGSSAALTITVLVALFAGALTHSLGLEAVFGAFIAGIVLGHSRFQEHEVFSTLQTITFTVMAPLFFAGAGLRADLALLRDPTVITWGSIVLLVASASKFLGAYIGSRFARLPRREGLALGVGLNARGAVEIVVATVGLSLNVLNKSSYTVVVLMAMVTSMMAPPLLRAALKGWKGSKEESERLERERMLGDNVLLRPSRLLLPSHGGPNSLLAARILDLAWPEGAEVTLFSAGKDVPAEDLERVRAVFASRPISIEHAAAKEPLDAILEQAVLGYGAIAVGATDTKVEGRLISPVVDALLAASPLPVIMVRRGARVSPNSLPRFHRLLVPAIGTQPGRAAQEMAYSLARRQGVRVLIAHVVTMPTLGQQLAMPAWPEEVREDASPLPPSERTEVAERVLAEARALAERMGARAETVIRTGVSAPEEILALARERGVDLIVLAANLRQLSGRPFLGHGVEYLLENSESTIVVVTAPPGWAR